MTTYTATLFEDGRSHPCPHRHRTLTGAARCLHRLVSRSTDGTAHLSSAVLANRPGIGRDILNDDESEALFELVALGLDR